MRFHFGASPHYRGRRLSFGFKPEGDGSLLEIRRVAEAQPAIRRNLPPFHDESAARLVGSRRVRAPGTRLAAAGCSSLLFILPSSLTPSCSPKAAPYYLRCRLVAGARVIGLLGYAPRESFDSTDRTQAAGVSASGEWPLRWPECRRMQYSAASAARIARHDFADERRAIPGRSRQSSFH